MIHGNIGDDIMTIRSRDGLNQADPFGMITDMLEELLEKELDLDDPRDDRVPGTDDSRVLLLLVKRGALPS